MSDWLSYVELQTPEQLANAPMPEMRGRLSRALKRCHLEVKTITRHINRLNGYWTAMDREYDDPFKAYPILFG